MESCPVIVTTPNGGEVVLDPAVHGDEHVEDLRRRVALAIGEHHRRVSLLFDATELRDGLTLLETLKKSGVAPISEGSIMLTAVVTELELAELRKHIRIASGWDDAPVGVATMDWINPDKYGMSYRNQDAHPHRRRNNDLVFPPALDMNINMLPFVLGEKESLPEEYHHYWPMIEHCDIPEQEKGQIGYLTIHEGQVAAGKSQRRPGLHMENPGIVMLSDGTYHHHSAMWGCGLLRVRAEHDSQPGLPRVEGGIYMASNVAKSCKVWNAIVTDPGLVAGHNGDLEHVREVLGAATLTNANTMYWITDKTPHESLPLEKDTYRQFFRLVTSQLSAWFPQHSHANRLGTAPDPSLTTIIEGNKFESGGYVAPREFPARSGD